MRRLFEKNKYVSDEPVYTIGAVSRMLKIHQQTIREYDRQGLVSPKRTPGATRLYSEADVERLRLIVKLVDEFGLNLSGVRLVLRLKDELDDMRRLANLIITQVDDAARERILAILEGRTGGLLHLGKTRTQVVPRRKIPIEEKKK